MKIKTAEVYNIVHLKTLYLVISQPVFWPICSEKKQTQLPMMNAQKYKGFVTEQEV